ncbi:MAG: holo-ACP synthase [Syntrophaceae bacterium]
MIDAVGVDIADVKRIKTALDRWGDRFVARVFSTREAEYCRRHRDEALRFAARFAAKEAFIKCLGSARGIRWHEIELLNDRAGKPVFRFSESIRKILEGRKIRKVHVSISHTAEYAVAFVVFEPGRDKDEKLAERN